MHVADGVCERRISSTAGFPSLSITGIAYTVRKNCPSMVLIDCRLHAFACGVPVEPAFGATGQTIVVGSCGANQELLFTFNRTPSLLLAKYMPLFKSCTTDFEADRQSHPLIRQRDSRFRFRWNTLMIRMRGFFTSNPLITPFVNLVSWSVAGCLILN